MWRQTEVKLFIQTQTVYQLWAKQNIDDAEKWVISEVIYKTWVSWRHWET